MNWLVRKGLDKIVEVFERMFPRFYAFSLTTWAITVYTLKHDRERSNMFMYFAFKTYATISWGWGICPLLSSPPRDFATQNKEMLMPRVQPGGGGGGWAQLKLTDELPMKETFLISCVWNQAFSFESSNGFSEMFWLDGTPLIALFHSVTSCVYNRYNIIESAPVHVQCYIITGLTLTLGWLLIQIPYQTLFFQLKCHIA